MTRTSVPPSRSSGAAAPLTTTSRPSSSTGALSDSGPGPDATPFEMTGACSAMVRTYSSRVKTHEASCEESASFSAPVRLAPESPEAVDGGEIALDLEQQPRRPGALVRLGLAHGGARCRRVHVSLSWSAP